MQLGEQRAARRSAAAAPPRAAPSDSARGVSPSSGASHAHRQQQHRDQRRRPRTVGAGDHWVIRSSITNAAAERRPRRRRSRRPVTGVGAQGHSGSACKAPSSTGPGPRTARGCRADGRAPPAPLARPRSAAPRSMPVSIPISWSIETRSSVAMLPVAPGRHRAAAELAERRLEALDPGLERRQHVREPLPAGVVEVGGQLDAGSASTRGREELADLDRVGHPGRVAEADLRRPGLDEPRGDHEHPLGGHVPLVGAAERGRDHALAAQPLRPARARTCAPRPGERLLDRAPDVLLVVGLRRRQEAVDLLEARAVRRAPARARARSGSAR